MSLISFSNITDGSTIDAADVNTPLNTIYNDYNGSITAANLASNAVTTVKITDANVTPAKWTNPYKFSVYRSAALNWATNTPLPFDTKTFDTSNNVDVVTNKGRFTVPINGFYYLKATVSVNIATQANTAFGIPFYKNGNIMDSGSAEVNMYNSNYSVSFNISDFQQLIAGDYIEVYNSYNPNTQSIGVGVTNCNFKGFLVTQT